MDVLAARKQANSTYQIDGTVLVNGAPPDSLRFRQSIAYVTQEDYLPVTETVRCPSARPVLFLIPTNWLDAK